MAELAWASQVLALTWGVDSLFDMHARPNPEPCLDADSHREALRQQAECCRRLAKATYDRHTSQILKQMAERFDQSADELQQIRQR